MLWRIGFGRLEATGSRFYGCRLCSPGFEAEKDSYLEAVAFGDIEKERE